MFNIQPLKTETQTPRRKRRLKITNFLSLPYLLILLILIVIPIVLILFYSMTVKVNDLYYQFSLKYFIDFFTEGTFVRTMGDSIVLAIITTVICLFIGYPTAWIIARQKPRTQQILILLVTAPMWINMLIRTLAWKQIFDMIDPNILGSNLAIITGMVYVFLPFMILPIYTVLSKIDPLLYEASHDLGASDFKTFTKVTLPLSIGGILSGITMVLLPAATTIVIPKILGTGRYMIGTLIEERFLKAGNWGYGSAIAIILAVIIMVMVLLSRRFDKSREVESDDY